MTSSPVQPDLPLPHRLHLGAGRLENLPESIASTFAAPTWMNLGDPSRIRHDSGALAKMRRHAGYHGWRAVPKEVFRALRRPGANGTGAPGAATHFSVWVYRKGDPLLFDDRSITFIFSEHFFEHLFFDEAAALLRECSRVLLPGGIIRTVVPDADLRADLLPEPVGFPGVRTSWTDPAKHKTRWSVYMLAELLDLCGLRPVPVRFFDKTGRLTDLAAPDIAAAYQALFPPGEGPIDSELAGRVDYIQRMNSLIVDGVKTS